jgi:DNA-binding transcriptional LysR family regulator
MDISALHTFLALARIGHMTHAAKSLHLTQPAISAQLARLEEDVGHRLFDRTPKGLVLTEAGELLRGHVERALGALSDGRLALNELAGLERGVLAIGGGATATTYLLPPLLGRFHASYPNIQLFVREQGSQAVVESILSGALDLGVVTLPLATQAAQTRGLAVEPWVSDELQLIVPAGHRLDGSPGFRWRELEGEPLVLFEAGSAVRALLDERLARANVAPHIVMELRSIESIKQMVAQGIGLAFVSRFALQNTERGIPSARNDVRRELAVVYRTDRSMSPAARAFLELMSEARTGPLSAGS